jgi:hypothetical protein
MLRVWGNAHDVAGADLVDRLPPHLHATGAGRHDQDLTERMRVPRGVRARVECDEAARRARGIGRLKIRIHAHGAGEVLGWARP